AGITQRPGSPLSVAIRVICWYRCWYSKGARRLDTNMLSDARVRNAKSGARPIKLSDAGGLHLLVQPHGSKLWRMAYRFDGKQKTLALGIYPVVTLQDARQQRDGAKRLLAKGIDPSAQRRLDKQTAAIGNTFKNVAEEVLGKLEKEGRAPRTLDKLR